MATTQSQDRLKHRLAFSTEGKVILIITLFVLISMLLEGMIYLQGTIFDGVRAYVRGEGLWAKAQKDAVIYLERYSYSQSEAHYTAYINSLTVIIGDKKARLALQEVPPNIHEARKGFLQGQNHPSDIDSLIWFFLNFQRVSYMRDAIAIWKFADERIEDFITTADEIRLATAAGGNDLKQMAVLREKIQNLNNELVELENRFSIVLGEGARWVKTTTWIISISMLTAFIGIGIVVSRQIIRGIAKSEKNLIISESRFRSLKDSNTIGIVSWRMDGRIDEANDIFLDMLGYQRSDMSGGMINWRDLTPVELQSRDEQAIAELMALGRCEPYEKALMHKEGYPVPIYLGASLIDGHKNQGIAYVMDLSERKKSEQQLKLAATVFAASNDGVLITDSSMRIVSANQSLCHMMGYNEEQLKGTIPKILQPINTTLEPYRDMWQSLNETGRWQGDLVNRMKNGALFPMRLSISNVRNSEGQVSHYVAIVTDITERKAAEEHLRHIAHHDTLTGLPNRVLFNDRIEQVVKHAARNKTKFAVLFFDLDHFKPVNDRFGHEVGDKLLQVVASRLTKNVRETDTVTRLGGDEFVILLEELTNLEMVRHILDKTVDSVCAPCQIDGHEMHIAVSVGVSVYPDDGTDAKSLMHHADIAMYGMKKSQRRRGQNSAGQDLLDNVVT